MAKIYLTAEDVAEALGISKGHAYVIIRECNEELKGKGYICVAGKVPVKYFCEKYYGFSDLFLHSSESMVKA